MKKPAWLIKLETPFIALFTTNVPHILEKIFLSLDYETYKECMDVCEWWKGLLKSASFVKRAKARFKHQISDDQVRLRYAATYGSADDVRRLVSSGMLDLNHCAVDSWGSTPLCNASMDNRLSVVKVLLELGAEVDRPGSAGQTALYWAAFYGHTATGRALYDAGARPNKANVLQGRTPLHAAANRGHTEMVKNLLDWGAGERFNRHSTDFISYLLFPSTDIVHEFVA